LSRIDGVGEHQTGSFKLVSRTGWYDGSDTIGIVFSEMTQAIAP
jgi:hypothetical protein